jgi:hypothetical protein
MAGSQAGHIVVVDNATTGLRAPTRGNAMTKLSTRSLVLAGTLTGALMAYAVPTAFAGDYQAFKRNEDTPDVVTTLDDDDDDDSGGDNTSFNSGTGNSNDGTNSRETRVSRDKDRSRDDLTKDRTRDGKGPSKRDWSQNRTNDRSRNDTR